MQRTGVFRPNLRLDVLTTRNEPERREHLVRLVRELDGAGIIYATSVRQVDLLHRLLNEVGFMAARDHRRMPASHRHAEFARFMNNQVQAIVTTDAFTPQGSKPDVRFVVHYALPKSIRTYYDGLIRAGLDGLRTSCMLFHDPAAARADDEFVSGQTPSDAAVAAVYRALEQLGGHTHEVPRTDVTSQVTSFGRDETRDAIAMLKGLGVIAEARGLKLRVRTPGLTGAKLQALVNERAFQYGNARRARDEMLAYAETGECRWKTLLTHFGDEVSWERCGTCDNCRRRPNGAPARQFEQTDPPRPPSGIEP